MSFDRERMRERSAALSAHGLYLGTSSWKYEGWLGQLYTPERYAYQGRLARTRFERDCLAEYSEVFRTVCVDAAYYTFPTEHTLDRMAGLVPEDFLFAFKVTDTVTIRRFPRLARFGDLAGKVNENYLNASLFERAFLAPCAVIRPKIGLLMFEFSRFWPGDYPRGRDFVADLEPFLECLPAGWPYAIEMRNREWLHPEYFDCLARHKIAHVFNSWEAMPSVKEQMTLPGSQTHPNRVAARFLLKPGRKYADAVNAFRPYDQTREVNVEARRAGAALIAQGLKTPNRKTFIYVNNRLEGNALSTLEAMIDMAL